MAAASGRGGSPAGPGRLDRRLIGELLRAAVAAPSMHNTQPWRFRVRHAASTIELRADPERMLPVGDPRGRAVHIACGAAVLNLRMAAAVAGLQTRVRLFPDPGEPLLLATIGLGGHHRATAEERELHAAIPRRHTNRGPFSSRPVPPGIRADLAEAAGREGALLHFPGHSETVRLLELAAEAEQELLADSRYRAELERWAGGPRDREGIPDSALAPRSLVGPTPVREFKPERRYEPVRYSWFEEHPQLAVLSTATDSPLGWLRAGQALQRVLLTATVHGIAACPLTQPLETADAGLVRDPRLGPEEPQMILRLGYGLPQPPGAPRRPISEVLDKPQRG